MAEIVAPDAPDALAAATADQPRARAALLAALGAGPSHAYLFRGPRGAGKATAARAFAAEILADGSPDPESARARALAEPSPHPDLVWLRPPGAWHLVDEIRGSVIRAASMRPFEGEHRVFVIEAADALREESQNALLKTLEEPAPFAHLILLCAEPEAIAQTIVSRCQPVSFAPLSAEAVAERLAGEAEGDELAEVARLSGGDLELARMLLTTEGRELRALAEAAARAATDPVSAAASPWKPLLESAEEAGARAGERATDELKEVGAGRRGSGKLPRDAVEQVKRVERRARTESLDLALALCSAWFRELAAEQPERAGAALELVLDTRRRLRLMNVSEELALDALWYRLEEILGS